MKTKHKVSILILLLLLIGGFIVFASGIEIPYLENYGMNFRKNMKSLTERMGINLPQRVEEFLDKTPEPLTLEEKLEIVEEMEKEEALKNQTPTPSLPSDEVNDRANSKILAQKSAYASEYKKYNNDLLCATDTALICFDNKGDEKWRSDIQVATPIMEIAGKYIVVAEEKANKIYLFNGSKKVWDISCENSIISADVSENGDVVIIADKPNYRGSVVVYNKKGEKVYQWNSGKYEIIDADISKGSRRLAVTLLNTESGADTKISLFNIKEKDSYASVEIKDSIVFDLEFIGERLNAIADNKILGISTDGKISWTYEFDGKALHKYQIEGNGYKLCVFDNNNAAEITTISGRGSEKASITLNSFPDVVNISDGRLIYNDDRTVYFSTLKGKSEKRYECTRDIHKLIILDSDSIAAIYNTSIEFINF